MCIRDRHKNIRLNTQEWVEIFMIPGGSIVILAEMICQKESMSETSVSYTHLSHHERYDGKGYPRGLKGEDIPLLGRILAVCDSFDAIDVYKRQVKEGAL